MRRLTELLEDAVGAPAPAFGFDDVVARAKTVHRRRRAGTAVALGAVFCAGAIAAALSLGHKTSGPAINVSPTTAPTGTGPWCVPISREQAIARVMRMYDYATSADTADAKLVNGPELHTLTPGMTPSKGEFDPSSLYWAVEVKSPNGSATVTAGMSEEKFAWAIYNLDARANTPGITGVEAGPDARSPRFDALPDHSDECTISPSPATDATPPPTAGVPITGARTAAASIGYVRQLVAQHRLPHASAIKKVWADGPVIVVSTTLTDRADAEELYEKLSTATGCDDSFLFVRGQRVVLADGSVVASPRPGYRTCAGT